MRSFTQPEEMAALAIKANIAMNRSGGGDWFSHCRWNVILAYAICSRDQSVACLLVIRDDDILSLASENEIATQNHRLDLPCFCSGRKDEEKHILPYKQGLFGECVCWIKKLWQWCIEKWRNYYSSRQFRILWVKFLFIFNQWYWLGCHVG